MKEKCREINGLFCALMESNKSQNCEKKYLKNWKFKTNTEISSVVLGTRGMLEILALCGQFVTFVK